MVANLLWPPSALANISKIYVSIYKRPQLLGDGPGDFCLCVPSPFPRCTNPEYVAAKCALCLWCIESLAVLFCAGRRQHSHAEDETCETDARGIYWRLITMMLLWYRNVSVGGGHEIRGWAQPSTFNELLSGFLGSSASHCITGYSPHDADPVASFDCCIVHVGQRDSRKYWQWQYTV